MFLIKAHLFNKGKSLGDCKCIKETQVRIKQSSRAGGMSEDAHRAPNWHVLFN